MKLDKRVILQLAVFLTVSAVSGSIMALNYMNLPKLLFGAGHYQVTVNLPAAAGLYKSGNVTYRGVEVGRVQGVHLTGSGVAAVLSLRSEFEIPSDLDAEVHSQTAIGEQFVELLPRNASSPPLKNGDVIAVDRTSIPPDISTLLDATNRGLQAIPRDDLRTTVDEAAVAVGGLGPEMARLVKGSTALAIDARRNLDSLTVLIDQSKPLLDTQIDTSDAIQRWAANTAGITEQLRARDDAVAGILETGPDAAEQARQLFDRVQPTLPILLTNLVSLGEVAVTYQQNLEQLLVLVPRLMEVGQGSLLANHNTKQDYKGAYLSFNLNLNLPPPCLTGYLPAQQARTPSLVDYPERPEGDIYCRTPQDSMFNVRGARNTPCVTRPGKRAPTVKMCESEEEYVPLNDGYNWKGDPNATYTGQGVPQQRSATADSTGVPPIAAAEYDPNTGSYIGPDGQMYTQTDLSRDANREQTWQSMMIPPQQN
ncbi:MAG: MlaD family protein [Mycolicibacterium fortuitum]|uniref:MCE family protein n=1 Tax=Mycolicibacterium fortuitum TaxID=1766 RepID=UPI0022BA2D6F|nr:MlaD family protein [Mycolicibacterium fortuitum]WAY19735.1 MCE family protein [Mycolicibacterium fortuitum]